MFKKLISVLALIIAMLTISAKDADAQCPAGYTPHTAYVEINGCDYVVEMCYICPTGPSPGSAQIQSITKLDFNCPQSLSFQQVLDAIEAQVFNWDYINNVICVGLDGPPCPYQSAEFEIKHWICWYSQLREYYEEVTMTYHPCDYGAYCWERFTVCFDGYNYVKTYTYPLSIEGEVNCTLESWEVYEPDELNEVSQCYIYHTVCNP